MAKIGCLGDIVFSVSSQQVKTIDNMKWSGSARYSTHQRHLNDALTEFTGVDPDNISFDIVLLTSLGADPMEDIGKLWQYERSGKAVPLIIGDHAYGKWRWSVVSHEVKVKTFSPKGNLMSVTISVKLQEYLKQ